MRQPGIIIASPRAQTRSRLVQAFTSGRRVRLIAQAPDLMHIYDMVETHKPDAVILCDILANLPEFEVMRRLFLPLDLKWMIFESGPAFARARYVDHPDVFRGDLVALKTHLFGQDETPVRKMRPPAPPPLPSIPNKSKGICLIGASTGGVDALLQILGRFPADCPPTFVVQHTGVDFGVSLVALLNRQSKARVVLAQDGQIVHPGMVVIGAGLRTHMVIRDPDSLRVGQEDSAPILGHRPSVDRLFFSAISLAPRMRVALLTGMGQDGAQGLKALRDAGAVTIAQDEASSVVFGMPKAAIECGGAEHVLPLDEIASALLAGGKS